jgi:hypothetical protein
MYDLKKLNRQLKFYTFCKIPMAFFASPKITEINDTTITMRIPLNFRTRNHLKCMYFGALAVGADLSSGFLAHELIRRSKQPIQLIFKTLDAQFLKRAESDVYFTCNDGDKIHTLVDKAIESKQREETPLEVIATTPDKLGEEAVAKFQLILSVKEKSRQS